MLSLIRRTLWIAAMLTVFAASAFLVGRYDLLERLTGVFLALQPWLPPQFNAEQFLVVLAVAGVLAAALSASGCVALIVRLASARQRELCQTVAAKREIEHIAEHHRHQYEQFLFLGRRLTERLDKRSLGQVIVEGASRLTSTPRADSVASLWLLQFETDTFRFETGLYCDEALFAQAEFQQTESPFAHVVSTQQPWVLQTWQDRMTFVRPEKLPQLGAATGMIVVPLVIENSVLGVVVLFCDVDVLKGYEEQRSFYHALWGELALGLSAAIQGEVTILDRLTGAHNRDYFVKRLIQEIERANRYRLPLSLLMIDIDNFKAINDTFGHLQGDAVLKITAKLIKKTLRAIDLVGRYGGEEFVVMLPETGYGTDGANATGAVAAAERIREAIDEEFRGLKEPLNITISIGVAVRRFPEDREADYRDLIRMADEQLYRAKTGGKNKVCVTLPQPNPQTVP